MPYERSLVHGEALFHLRGIDGIALAAY